MLGWFIRILLLISGFIADWFILRDDLHFEIYQMVIAVLLVTSVMAIAAFWPFLKAWFAELIKKD